MHLPAFQLYLLATALFLIVFGLIAASVTSVLSFRNHLKYDRVLQLDYTSKISRGLYKQAQRDDFILVSMDLNLLKYYNDTYGHEKGNELRLSTAIGYVWRSEFGKEVDIRMLYQEADERMYQNKKEMKEKQPELFRR